MLVDTVTVSTQLSLASMSGNNSMHFLLTAYMVSLNIVSSVCLVPHSSQSLMLPCIKLKLVLMTCLLGLCVNLFHSIFIGCLA